MHAAVRLDRVTSHIFGELLGQQVARCGNPFPIWKRAVTGPPGLPRQASRLSVLLARSLRCRFRRKGFSACQGEIGIPSPRCRVTSIVQ